MPKKRVFKKEEVQLISSERSTFAVRMFRVDPSDENPKRLILVPTENPQYAEIIVTKTGAIHYLHQGNLGSATGETSSCFRLRDKKSQIYQATKRINGKLRSILEVNILEYSWGKAFCEQCIPRYAKEMEKVNKFFENKMKNSE